MRAHWAWFVSLLGFALLAIGGVTGCDAGSDPGLATGGSAAAAAGVPGGGGSGAEGGCFLCGGGGTGAGSGDSIIIDPQNVMLDVVNGNIPTQAFTATWNGNDVTNQVTWVYNKPGIGDMSGPVFTPTGNVGGVGTLLALYSDAEGSTSVGVNVTITNNPGGLPQADQDAFNNPGGGADPALNVVYPYDETTLPLKVLSPDFQWTGQGGADTYRLRLTSQYMEYIAFLGPGNSYIIPQQDWENIEFSGNGPVSDPLAVELSRKVGATVYEPVTLTLHIAQGIIHGSVYYWQLPDACGGDPNGKILRIAADSETTDEFYPYGQCWGCHTVSRDGTKLAAEFNSGNGPMYTLDLQANPVGWDAINPNAPSGNFIFAAFDDDGDRLMASDNTSYNPSATPLVIVDATNGQTLNPNAMGSGCGEPAWSPDGTKIAGICNLSGGGWIFDANAGDLMIADIDAASTVTNQTTVVAQGALPGRPAYPSFSPDNAYLAYGRPTYGSRSIGDGTLWMVGVDGSNPTELAVAGSDNRSFNPVFAPKSAGGYYWVVFISRRDYGHKLTNANRQQLWVAAIDDPPQAGDPSHPPFYLRGQQMCGKSENAYYALDPCKEIGESCSTGIECCNGQCLYDPQLDDYVCGEPPDPNECIQTGNACQADEDCCDYPEVVCIQGFCQPPPPR